MGNDSLAQHPLTKYSFARKGCDFGPLVTPLRLGRSRSEVQSRACPTISLSVNAPQLPATLRPYVALVQWRRYAAQETDGWMFRAPGHHPEPCPEDAWGLGPVLESVPKVAEILARKGGLAFVIVENPRNPRMVYMYTRRGGGHWQDRSIVLASGLGASTAVRSLLEAQAA